MRLREWRGRGGGGMYFRDVAIIVKTLMKNSSWVVEISVAVACHRSLQDFCHEDDPTKRKLLSL